MIYRLEEEKELTYQGVMYDVVKSGIDNGKPVYLCIADATEAELINKANVKTNLTSLLAAVKTNQ